VYILAYYFFTHVDDPQAEVVRHRNFLEKKDIRCRVYISHEGINGQMSAAEADAEAYMAWLKADRRFSHVVFKRHTYPAHVFPRQTVKWRKQLVALDREVNVSQGGTHIPPREFRNMLEQGDEQLCLLDVRNRYEWEIGHFEGARLPPLNTFREFPAYAQKLKEECHLEHTTIMMYCTGGIRCELFSALLRKEGFQQIYQLQGGVIQYGLDEGCAHWRGKLFVFDNRLAVPIGKNNKTEVISRCAFCKRASDMYYNCANVECNALFLACPDCLEKEIGCCSIGCQKAPRMRRNNALEPIPDPLQS
jgi:UPF0176 protein